MNKGIIIVDVPERCDDCLIRHAGMAWCQVAQRSTSYTKTGKQIDERKRPEWCPIQPMPEKMKIYGKYPQPDRIVPSYKYGWNACIDEMLKGTEAEIEKKKPKRPEYYGDSENGKILCPNCRRDLRHLKGCGFSECPFCEQAIDWSGEENIE